MRRRRPADDQITTTNTLLRVPPTIRCISALLQDAAAWWPWGAPPIPEQEPFNFTLLTGEAAGLEWLEGAEAAESHAMFAHRGKHLLRCFFYGVCPAFMSMTHYCFVDHGSRVCGIRIGTKAVDGRNIVECGVIVSSKHNSDHRFEPNETPR